MPFKTPMQGRFCRLEQVDPLRHGKELFQAFSDETLWTYLPCGPFASVSEFQAFIEKHLLGNDMIGFAILDQTGRAVGLASYLRIEPLQGSIEVGGIVFSPTLQRTRAATEAMFLMMQRAFDELGYRRYEWKCDALNEPSIVAARRLGFQFEGIFRQHIIYKGRNRDTAWFSIIDAEWPRLKESFLQWLDKANFDDHGKQRSKLHHGALGSA